MLSTIEQLQKFCAANNQAFPNTKHYIKWTTCCQHTGSPMIPTDWKWCMHTLSLDEPCFPCAKVKKKGFIYSWQSCAFISKCLFTEKIQVKYLAQFLKDNRMKKNKLIQRICRAEAVGEQHFSAIFFKSQCCFCYCRRFLLTRVGWHCLLA